MKTSFPVIQIAVVMALLAVVAFAQAPPPPPPPPEVAPEAPPDVEAQPGPPAAATRFAFVDLFVDAAEQPLAAYQLEFEATAGDVKIVGVEGGQHAAFKQAPYYDPEAMQRERVILAAFSTADAAELPVGKTRVATIHLQTSGDIEPQYAIKLVTSATAEGAETPATLSIEKGS